MQFFTTGQHALNNGIKVLVYGRTSAGKTRLILTAPAPFIISAENGTLSIAEANIPGSIIRTAKDLDETYDWIVRAPEARQFQTICLDSLTELAETTLSDEKARNKDPRAAYGEMQDKIALHIRNFRDLKGKHVYFTAQGTLKKQADGIELYSASMPGQKMTAAVPYYFDEFFCLDVDQYPDPANPGKFIRYNFLRTVADTRFEAKDRSGALEPVEKPDLSYIFAKILARFSAPVAPHFQQETNSMVSSPR